MTSPENGCPHAHIERTGTATVTTGATCVECDELFVSVAEVERLRNALDGLLTVAAGIARRSDVIDQMLAAGAIAAARGALDAAASGTHSVPTSEDRS